MGAPTTAAMAAAVAVAVATTHLVVRRFHMRDTYVYMVAKPSRHWQGRCLWLQWCMIMHHALTQGMGHS